MKVPSGKKLGFSVSRSLWVKIVNYYKSTYTGVIPTSYPMEDFALHRLESSRIQLKRVQSLKISPKSICLDAGCGIGAFALLANLSGLNYYGFDVDQEALKIARELFKSNNLSPKRLQPSTGSPNIKHKKFDLITSFEVIEHVDNLGKYVKCIRKIIANDGIFFMEMPNYLIPYEPHYYVFFPFGSKSLCWTICLLKGRTNRKFFDDLQFITPIKMEGVLKKYNFTIDNIGAREFIDTLSNRRVVNRNKYIKLLASTIQKFHLKWILSILVKSNLYTPLIYIARPQN